jgi:hypothetical protein
MWDDNWKQLIAGSKFKNWAGFGMFQKAASPYRIMEMV